MIQKRQASQKFQTLVANPQKISKNATQNSSGKTQVKLGTAPRTQRQQTNAIQQSKQLTKTKSSQKSIKSLTQAQAVYQGSDKISKQQPGTSRQLRSLASNRQSDKYLKIAPMSTTNAKTKDANALMSHRVEHPTIGQLGKLQSSSQEPQIIPSARVNSNNNNRFSIEVIN